MSYKTLDRNTRKSLDSSIQKVLFEMLELSEFQWVSENHFIDDDVVEMVRMELLKEFHGKSWRKFVEESTTHQLSRVIVFKGDLMRKVKPSSSQIKSFLKMKYELGDDVVPSEDYLVFCKQMYRLKNKYDSMGPVGEMEVEKLKRKWKEQFGTELVFHDWPNKWQHRQAAAELKMKKT